jgi:hypothetical protein
LIVGQIREERLLPPPTPNMEEARVRQEEKPQL